MLDKSGRTKSFYVHHQSFIFIMVKYIYEIKGGGQNLNEVTKMEGKIDILHMWIRLIPPSSSRCVLCKNHDDVEDVAKR